MERGTRNRVVVPGSCWWFRVRCSGSEEPGTLHREPCTGTMNTNREHGTRNEEPRRCSGFMLVVPGSTFRLRGTRNLAQRSLQRNDEHEPGTWNAEPGTASLFRVHVGGSGFDVPAPRNPEPCTENLAPER